MEAQAEMVLSLFLLLSSGWSASIVGTRESRPGLLMLGPTTLSSDPQVASPHLSGWRSLYTPV